MTIGPGKYDDLCTLVRQRVGGDGVIVIVLGGDRGNGFAFQADLKTALLLPQMLRHTADQIESDSKGETKQ